MKNLIKNIVVVILLPLVPFFTLTSFAGDISKLDTCSYDIAFVGTYSVDVALNGFTEIPTPKKLSFLSGCKITTGGGACNSAIAAARMGKDLKIISVGVIGEDEQANIILQRLKKENIDTTGLVQDKTVGTGTTVLFVPPAGQTLGVVFVGGNGTVGFSPKVMEKLLQSRIIVFSELFLLPGMEKDMKEMLSIFKNMGKTIIIDTSPNVRNFEKEKMINLISDIAPFVDYFTPNNFEAEIMTGEKDIENQAQKLENIGFRNVIIKNGSEGALIKQVGEKSKIISAIKTTCVDSAGAGDAFIGGFSYNIAKNTSLEDAVTVGNVLGGLCVGQIGASTGISRDKINAILSKLKKDNNSNVIYNIPFSPKQKFRERVS